jgi:outer membrane protein assembly factor BamB
MYLGCPERRGRSAAVGPATPDNIRYLGEVSHYTETENWSLDSMSWSGPVISSDGTLYIGSTRYYYDDDYPTDLWSQQILAFDPDGTERVIYETELMEVDFLDPSPAYPPEGLTISADGHIYFPVTNEELESSYSAYKNKIIFAFDNNGEEVLQTQPYLQWHKTLGPDGVFYVNEYVDQSNKYFVALAPDGTELWRFNTGDRFPSSPALDPQGRIYFFLPSYGYAADDAILLALQPDGSLLWEKRVADAVSCHNGYKGLDFTCPLSIGDNGSIYVFVGDYNEDDLFSSLRAYSADGDLLWSRPVDGSPMGSIAIGPGTMVVGATNEGVYAFSPDGDLLWTYEGEISTLSGGRPAIDGEGTTYIGISGGLHAIRRDGTLKWRVEGFIQWHAVVIGADGTLYVSTGNKGLCVIEH